MPTSEQVEFLAFNSTTAFGYDNDRLLTCASPSVCPAGAGALTLVRNTAHGMTTSLQQGNVTEAWTYNTFGELATQVSAFSGSPLLSLTYRSTPAPRDNLGRVVTKTEVRGGVTTTTEIDTSDQSAEVFGPALAKLTGSRVVGCERRGSVNDFFLCPLRAH